MLRVAYFETENSSRYLEALCKHFGRKVEVRFDSNVGWVRFDLGRCDMTADAKRLELIASADDATSLDFVVDIVTRHLERHAFRENPQLTWRALEPSENSSSKQDT